MKTSILLLSLALVSPVVAQDAPTPTVPSHATFGWKLRLTKGQTWTQTMTSTIQSNVSTPDPRTKKAMRIETNVSQTLGIKNVVLDATPTFYLIRATYTAFNQKIDIKMNGKSTPMPATPDYSKALVGASFTVEQTPDGRIVDVTGLEDLMKRQQRIFASPIPTPQERAALARYLPSAKTIKDTIIKNQSAALPKTPLAVGQSFSYAVALPASFPVNVALSGQKTLRSFDAQSATFDDTGSFNTSATKPIGTGATKTYIAMKGTISGQSVVDAQTGLPRTGTFIMVISGKVTVVPTRGARTSVPLDVTMHTTVATTTP